VIVILGTMLGMILSLIWVIGKTGWDAVEANDARKVFATEVFTTIQARLPGFARNGKAPESNGQPGLLEAGVNGSRERQAES
jgi:hypothetical protein